MSLGNMLFLVVLSIGMPTYGYKLEIVTLMRNMKSRGVSRPIKKPKAKQPPTATKFDKEL